MRLFEATGCGAMLVTDHKDNLADLFEIGEEVVAYRTTDEAAALIEYYLSHPDEAKSIAAAGQKRVLKDHTYEKRMQKVGKILHRHLRYKDEHKRLPKLDLNAISHGYSNVAEKKITSSMWSAWQNASIPKKQRALVQKELSDMYRGQQPVIYNVLAEIVRPYVRDQSSILEIGCASGYYYEILEYLLGKNIKYVGVDISEHLIEMARDYYPGVIFEIADGAKLPYEDEQFEITISSTVLLHVRNYIAHIREAARVSQRYVVFHRTPICRKRETQIQSKFGYGVEMVEFRYKESDLLATFAQNGLRLLNSIEYVSNPAEDVYETTYLLERGVLSPATAASPGRAHTQSAPRPEITVVETDRLQASGPGIERPIDQIAFHRLNPADPFYANLVKNPQEAGLTESDLEGKPESRRAELIIGEYFARLSQYCGQVASRLLFKAQWQYVTPDWFDQRHHLLDTEKWFNDYWTESADNVLRVLPYRGRLLDLCCGDGFYDYYFYRKRASEVICVDINETAYRQACRLHSADNITYHLASVLTFEPEPGSFDVVVIRGAIEHFSQENQQLLFRKALKAMKPDGWFCGDTPANPDKNEHKQLPAHENEWADEAEMKRELQQVFEHVETCAIETEERTTLFWRCRKCQPVNAE
jgi:SAM-dependent methyltransferase